MARVKYSKNYGNEKTEKVKVKVPEKSANVRRKAQKTHTKILNNLKNDEVKYPDVQASYVFFHCMSWKGCPLNMRNKIQFANGAAEGFFELVLTERHVKKTIFEVLQELITQHENNIDNISDYDDLEFLSRAP